MAETTLHDEIQAAEAEIATGHPEAALERCQQLQARFPRALVIQRVLGETYLAQRKAREALAVLERALEGDPEDARACCARALIHQIHGDSSAALAWYRRACDIRPDDGLLRDAYRELATHLNQPPYRPTSFGLARLYVRGALFTHAEREWQSILAEQPDRLDAQVGLAETLWRAGDQTRALDLARRIVANTGTCVKALLIVSALEHEHGNDDEARRLLARAAELDPERRIGLALYSDRFASGDLALHGLLMGEGTTAGAIDDLPTQQVPAATVPRVPGVQLSSGPRAELEEFNAFAQSRTTQIPADFHQIFAETEFMLWGKDDEAGAATDTVERAPASGQIDSPQRSRAERPRSARAPSAHSAPRPARRCRPCPRTASRPIRTPACPPGGCAGCRRSARSRWNPGSVRRNRTRAQVRSRRRSSRSAPCSLSWMPAARSRRPGLPRARWTCTTLPRTATRMTVPHQVLPGAKCPPTCQR